MSIVNNPFVGVYPFPADKVLYLSDSYIVHHQDTLNGKLTFWKKAAENLDHGLLESENLLSIYLMIINFYNCIVTKM